MRDHFRIGGIFSPVRFARRTMQFADFLLVLNFCLFPVERLKESLLSQYGMGGPLLRERVEGWCSKEFQTILVVVVRAAAVKSGGRPKDVEATGIRLHQGVPGRGRCLNFPTLH